MEASQSLSLSLASVEHKISMDEMNHDRTIAVRTRMHRLISIRIAATLALLGVVLCSAQQPTAPKPVLAQGLENLFQLSARLYSDSRPQGEQGFAQLQELGVKTIISVDGS